MKIVDTTEVPLADLDPGEAFYVAGHGLCVKLWNKSCSVDYAVNPDCDVFFSVKTNDVGVRPKNTLVTKVNAEIVVKP